MGVTAKRENVVLACSALKKNYRDELAVDREVRFVYLKGSYDLIYQRLKQRHGHFASAKILAGQFADLQEPDDALTVEIDQPVEDIVAEIRHGLGLDGDSTVP